MLGEQRYFWTVLLVIVGQLCFAQNFSILSDLEPYTDQGKNLYLEGDTVITTGVHFYVPDSQNIYICKSILSSNDTIYMKEYGLDTMTFRTGSDVSNPLIATSDGNMLMCGSISTPGDTKHFGMGLKFDGNGDTLWFRKYGDTVTDTISNLYFNDCIEHDGYYYFCGFETTDSIQSDGVIQKVDYSGNVIWKKRLGAIAVSDNLYSIDSYNGGLILAGYTEWGPSVRPWLLKVDTSANIQWQRSFGNAPGYGVAKYLSTGEILVVGSDQPTGLSEQQGFIAKYSSTGSEIWKKAYGLTQMLYDDIRQAIELPNTDIVIVGVSRDSVIGDYLGWIMKTDSAGEIKWSKWYQQRPSQIHYLQDIALCSDGGFVANGSSSPLMAGESWDSWLLRVDSLGCDSVVCLSNTVIEAEPPNFKLYPNPADNAFFIESEQLIKGYKINDYTGRLILSAGNVSRKEVVVDTHDLKNGIYVITLEFASGVTKVHRVVIQKGK